MGFSWTTVAIVQLIQRQEKAFVREATSLCVSPSEPGQECCWCQFLLPHRHYDLSASIRMLSEVHGRSFLNFFCRTLIVCPKISSCYKPWLQHLKSMPAAQNWPSTQEPRRACSSWHSPTKSLVIDWSEKLSGQYEITNASADSLRQQLRTANLCTNLDKQPEIFSPRFKAMNN